jgi:hypothetical protein
MPAVPAPVTGPIPIPEAAVRLARLGFLLVNGSNPAAPGGAQLIATIRDHPTLEHFDPEIVQHWSVDHGKGHIVDVTAETALPLRRPFSWGTIRVTDRLDVYNSFLTFGGEVEGSRVDAHQVVVVFRSPAPILRWTGHSQAADLHAGEVGAFFARMMIPIDFVPGAEERIGSLAPLALYAAFLGSGATDPVIPSFVAQPWQDPRLLASEAVRVRDGFPDAWAAGLALAEELKLDGR